METDPCPKRREATLRREKGGSGGAQWSRQVHVMLMFNGICGLAGEVLSGQAHELRCRQSAVHPPGRGHGLPKFRRPALCVTFTRTWPSAPNLGYAADKVKRYGFALHGASWRGLTHHLSGGEKKGGHRRHTGLEPG
jgi:hypothetical protein